MEEHLDYGVGILALFILYLFLKEIMIPFMNRKQASGSPPGSIYSMLKDLHIWHSPDGKGEQSWKGTHIARIMEDLKELVQQQNVLVRDNNALTRELIKCMQRRHEHEDHRKSA